jgi:hypothetical protein
MQAQSTSQYFTSPCQYDWLACHWAHEPHQWAGQVAMTMDGKRHLYCQVLLPCNLSRLHNLALMEVHLEKLGAAACPILPLAGRPWQVLDCGAPCTPRSASPYCMPPMRPRPKNDSATARRVHLLAANLAWDHHMALDPLLCAHCHNQLLVGLVAWS